MQHLPSQNYRIDSTTPIAHNPYLFYKSSRVPQRFRLPAGYTVALWRASLRTPWPSGIADLRTRARFAFRVLLNCARLFTNREVGALCIYFAGRLVHYSGFTPRYWRFPFLADEDLQIGDTWTDLAHRCKGLAGYALHEIIEMKQARGRGFWYVVGAGNHASIRVVERAHFQLRGVGEWHKPWGIKLLGSSVPSDADDVSRLARDGASSNSDDFLAAPIHSLLERDLDALDPVRSLERPSVEIIELVDAIDPPMIDPPMKEVGTASR